MQCPHCGYDNLPGMKFCGQCGERLGRSCAACGFINPLAHRFCGECGARLGEAPVPTEAVAAAAQPPPPQPPVEASVATGSPTTQLEGERRLATVILADVQSSTDLLGQIGTEAWVGIMNHVLHVLESEVYRFGGQVDQFRGDGLVAFFGATSAHEDDPERAVLAALAMHKALEPYAADLSGRQDIDLQLRVGVNTGEVIVTSVGDIHHHREDTAMGEAVALAARMESAAEPGTVLVSENTYRLVETQFEWQPLGEISVKGISQPIAVYRPLVPRTDSGHAYGLSVPLIGRDAEFQALKGCVDDLHTGRGGIALVMGDKGMGKSFLVAEVRQHFARRGALLAEARDRDAAPLASLAWLSGRCRSYYQSWPYSMWLSLLRSWLGMHWGEPEEEARKRLRRQTEALWGDQLAEYYPYLATFLSLPLEEEFAERVKHLDAEGLHRRFFLTIRAWVEAIAQRGPLVLAFADVQWADSTSLDLLRYCLPLCDQESLLWLIVYRSERTSPVWGFRHYVETEYPHRLTALNLPALTEDQGREFIELLIGSDALPKETRGLVLDKAEGNPYYIGELIQSLIARGTLVRNPETSQWRVTRAVDSLDLPDSLQSMLLARIDRLSPEERHVLQMAAVIGSVFWSDVLESLADDETWLKEHLTALQRAGLVYERGRVPDLGMEYVFTSNLVRDAAYESLLRAQRLKYHSRVAEHLEQIPGKGAMPQHYGLLAYHYRQAGELGKELFYTLLAADQARGIYANAEALARYTRALELLDAMEAETSDKDRLYAIRTQRFEVLDGRREMFFLMGDWDAVRADAQALLRLARQLEEDPTWLIDALLQQPGVAGWQSKDELSAGVPLAAEALALAQQVDDRRREMQSLAAIARQRLWVNDPTAWELAERALDLARQLGDRNYEVSMLIGMGQVYAWSDQPERGMAYLEAALPISQALDNKMAEMNLLGLVGLQDERRGDYYRLLIEHHQERLRISREIGHRPMEAHALMQCGQTLGLYLGDYQAGLAQLEACQRLWEGTPNEMFAWLRIAQIYAVDERYAEALKALEQVNRIVGLHAVQDMGHAGLCLVSAMLYNALGGRHTAEDEKHLRKALEFTARVRRLVADAPLTRQYEMAAACESAMAHLRLAQGWLADEAERDTRLRRALESSQTALDIYQHFGFVQVIECVSEEILYRHSLTLAANGNKAESADYLRLAHQEMMRKHALIPSDSSFRSAFLENIALHCEIREAVAALPEDERDES
jgi:class 3 adenylate cyclase/tetratricopeptide (TPR) repeat protein